PAEHPPPSRIVLIPPAKPAVEDLYGFDALVFVPHEARGRVVTIRCAANMTRRGPPRPMPFVDEWFPGSTPTSRVLTKSRGTTTLRRPLEIWYCPVSQARQSPLNRAVAQLTMGAEERPWYGPVVVMKFYGPSRKEYADADTREFPRLANFFRKWP
ncbi:hypothetical protein K466DRAFT_501552, partial [Polyporus arcularius HHB13444]